MKIYALLCKTTSNNKVLGFEILQRNYHESRSDTFVRLPKDFSKQILAVENA